mgnify:CR=1 FL=1
MIDPKKILEAHFKDISLTREERRDIEATFQRFVEITGEAVAGANVEEQLRQIDAQIKLWKSGALSATQAALWNAASEYAKAASSIVAKVLQGAVSGLL